MYELKQVIKAAEQEPFQNYAMDGDSHWTIEAVKDWWSRIEELKDKLRERIRRENSVIEKVALERWLLFLNTEAESEIRQYIFFRDTGQYPKISEKLPNI